MNRIKVLVEEQQEILREAYKMALSAEPSVQVIDVRDGSWVHRRREGEAACCASGAEPDVLLIGTRTVQSATIELMEEIRAEHPRVGIVLLAAQFDAESIGQLKKFSRSNPRGAYLLKTSISTRSELIRVIHDVSEGRLLVDPQVFAGMMQEPVTDSPISDLTGREMEVLTWLSMGYRNSAIAQELCLEPKTVERHISSIFSKLNKGEDEVKHPRVDAVITYFKATGQLHLSRCN